MAKKKKAKKDMTKLVANIVIIALAVLTICTLFMPVINSATVATKIGTGATGMELISAAFASEASLDMSAGTALLYGYKIAEETAFVTTVFMWAYMLTIAVSVASIVFAVLNILGMKFKMVNTILGAALALLALVTFIFGIVVASKNTAVTEVLGVESGIRTVISVGIYMLLGTLVAGGAEVYLARKK